MSEKRLKTTIKKEPKLNNSSATKFKKLNLWLNEIGKALNTVQLANYK